MKKLLSKKPLILLLGISLPALAFVALQEPASIPLEERIRPPAAVTAQGDVERAIPMDGIHNFRDIGGYKTSDGRQVKWGMLYRSGDINNASEQDRAFMANVLKISSVSDFRNDEEKAEAPFQGLGQARYHDRGILAQGTDRKKVIDDLFEGNPEKLKGILTQANRDIVKNFTSTYRQWLHSLTDDGALPQIIHCTAGKDRTGFATAMLLLVLGVPQETVINDYLLSNQYLHEYIDDTVTYSKWVSFFLIKRETLLPLLTVETGYLNAAFDQIEKDYGSLDNYIREGLQIDQALQARLRDKFLSSPENPQPL